MLLVIHKNLIRSIQLLCEYIYKSYTQGELLCIVIFIFESYMSHSHILKGSRNVKIYKVFIIIKNREIVGLNDYTNLNFDDNKPYVRG